MWEFLLRQIQRQALKQGAKQAIPKDPFGLMPEPMNESVVYVERIKREFHIDDYYDALELYHSDPAYWQEYYRPLPSPDPARERIRDSAAAAGVPSRNNVWEYDYPDTNASPSPANPASASKSGLATSPAAPVPAFAPDAVYSPMGDFYGNFPDTSGAGPASPDVVAPSRSSLAPANPPSNAPRSLLSYLMGTGNFAKIYPGLLSANAAPSEPQAWQASPPLQPDAAQDAPDNGPTRFLVGRVYDPSQGSPIAARPAPSQASPDGSLSLNDAYLEYLKRLNGNQSLA